MGFLLFSHYIFKGILYEPWHEISNNVARVLHQVECLGALGLTFKYDGGPIIEIGGPIFLYKLQILEGSISFSEGSVLSPGQ